MKRRIVIRANRMIPVTADGFDAKSFRDRHKSAARKTAQSRAYRQDDIVNQIRESEDPISTAFELLVPASGAAKSVAGEMVRAMMRILYRDFNDGDVFYEGYGIETCGEAVAYLCTKFPELESKFEDIAMRNFKDNNYTNAIKDIADIVIDKIYEDPELVVTPNNEDMFDYDGEEFIREREWEPEYELEFDVPDSVYAHIEKGNISVRDLEYEISTWDGMSNVTIDVAPEGSWIEVRGLNKDSYDLLEDYMDGWLEEYGDQLNDEYGDPEEDGDEDDEY